MNYLLVVIWIAMGFSAAAWLRKRGRYGDRLTYSAFWDILLPAVAGPALLLLARPWSELPGAGHLLTTGRARMKANVRQNFGTRDLIRIATLSLAALASLGTLLVLFMAWRTIEPGYVGIVFDKGLGKRKSPQEW